MKLRLLPANYHREELLTTDSFRIAAPCCSGSMGGGGKFTRLQRAWQMFVCLFLLPVKKIFVSVQFYYLDLHKSLIFSFISDAVALLPKKSNFLQRLSSLPFICRHGGVKKHVFPSVSTLWGKRFFLPKGRKISDIKLLRVEEKELIANIRNSSHSKLPPRSGAGIDIFLFHLREWNCVYEV